MPGRREGETTGRTAAAGPSAAVGGVAVGAVARARAPVGALEEGAPSPVACTVHPVAPATAREMETILRAGVDRGAPPDTVTAREDTQEVGTVARDLREGAARVPASSAPRRADANLEGRAGARSGPVVAGAARELARRGAVLVVVLRRAQDAAGCRGAHP